MMYLVVLVKSHDRKLRDMILFRLHIIVVAAIWISGCSPWGFARVWVQTKLHVHFFFFSSLIIYIIIIDTYR